MSTFDPASFDYGRLGLSSDLAILLIIMAIIAVYALLFHETTKNEDYYDGGKWRPFHHLAKEWHNNKSSLWALVRKSLVGRYNNSYFGILWNIISPTLLVLCIFFIFINIKEIHTDRNYWTYIVSGLFAFTMCRQAVGGNTFYSNSMIIKKLPTPGWTMILADTIASFITYAIACLVSLALILTYEFGEIDFGQQIIMPLLFVNIFIFCFGLNMLFSTLTVICPDVKHVMVTLSRALIWVSPIFFYLMDCNNLLLNVSMFNPFTYFLEPLHQIVSFGIPPTMILIGVSVLITILTLGLGLYVYEKKFDRVREML